MQCSASLNASGSGRPLGYRDRPYVGMKMWSASLNDSGSDRPLGYRDRPCVRKRKQGSAVQCSASLNDSQVEQDSLSSQ